MTNWSDQELQRLVIYKMLYELLAQTGLDGQADARSMATAVILCRYLLKVEPTSTEMARNQQLLRQTLDGEPIPIAEAAEATTA